MVAGHVVDFLGALALIGMLSVSYGLLGRTAATSRWRPVLLGALFGLVAAAGMFQPLSPVEGVIVDMRCVPVALAGAFLGLRGLAVCLVIVAAVRIGIGGEGLPAGLASLAIAAGAGLAWAAWAPDPERRTARHFLVLGPLVALHVLAAWMLTPELRGWYFQSAAPLVVALNLVTLPAFAALLNGQVLALCRQDRIRSGAGADPSTGLLLHPHFEEALVRGGQDGGPSGLGALLVLRLRRGWLAARRDGGVDPVLTALRVRLQDLLGAERPMTALPGDRVAVAMTRAEMGRADAVETAIRRALRATSVQLESGERLHLAVDVHTREFSSGGGLAAFRSLLTRRQAPRGGAGGERRPTRQSGQEALTPEMARMFSQYDAVRRRPARPARSSAT
jgi:hypothetical protein